LEHLRSEAGHQNIEMNMEWHSSELKEVLAHLKVTPDKGLTNQEAEERLHKYGLNEIQKHKGPSALRMLRSSRRR